MRGTQFGVPTLDVSQFDVTRGAVIQSVLGEVNEFSVPTMGVTQFGTPTVEIS